MNSIRKTKPTPLFYALWRARPRLMNNPVILRELIVRMRSSVSFIYLSLMLAVGAICILAFWSSMQRTYMDANRWDRNVREFFMIMNIFQGMAVACLIPLLSSTIINNEREKETWDLLITTPLSMASVVIGKLLSSILFVWLMLFALAPIYGIFFLIGGISYKETLFIFVMMTEVIVVIGLIGLACSILWKRTVTAVSAAFIFGSIYLIGIPFLRPIFKEMFDIGPPEFGPEFLLSPAIITVLFFANETPPNMGDHWALVYEHPYASHAIMVAIAVVGLALLCVYLLGMKRESKWFRLQYIELSPRFKKHSGQKGREYGFVPDGANAVHHKDTVEISRKLWFKIGNAALFALIAWTFFGSMYWGAGDVEKWARFLMCFTLFIPLFVFPYAANAIRNEWDRDTMDLLFTTTMTPQKILQGKYRAGMELIFTRLLYFVFPVLAWIGIILLLPKTWDTRAMEISVGATLMCVTSAYFFLSIGLFYSTFMPNTMMAYAMTFGTGMMLYFGTLLGFEIFRDALDIPYEIHRTVFYPIMGTLSPFFNYIQHGQMLYYSSMSGPGSHKWAGMYWWSILFFQTVWMISVALLARIATHWRFSLFVK